MLEPPIPADVLLYQLIAGRLPFAGRNDLQAFSSTMTRPPLPLRAQLKEAVPPEQVEEILQRCLRKNRDERFDSMRALAASLRAVGS